MTRAKHDERAEAANAKPAPPSDATLLTVAGPLLGLLLYLSILGNPLSVPDLPIVSDSALASVNFPGDMIWLKPMPPERPDLGTYRPIHGMLLKIQFMLFPGRIAALRAVSLSLFAILCLVYSLLVIRLIPSTFGRMTAIAILAVHPMATESVNGLFAQNVLLAALCWVGALYVYQLSREGKIGSTIASPIIGVLFFLALGSHEAAILLPLSLIALDILGPRSQRPKDAPPEANGILRAFIYGLPIALGALILFALRWMALEHRLGPVAAVQAAPDWSVITVLLSGCSLVVKGIAGLSVLYHPTHFQPYRYDPGIVWPLWIGIPILALLLVQTVVDFRKPETRVKALGFVLMLVPLLSMFQVVPLTNVLSDRILFLALPWFGIHVGGGLAALCEILERKNKRNGISIVWGVTGVVLVLWTAVTLTRTYLWSHPQKLWEAEARRHPTAPDPLTFQFISMVTQPGAVPDITGTEAKAAEALKLAKPPDADPIYQYLALMHVARRNLDDLQKTIQEGLAQEGPHHAGFYSALGVAALFMNLDDLAEVALQREIEAWPRDFNALYALAGLYLKKKDWPTELEFARRAAALAPSHMAAQAQFRLGMGAIQRQDSAEEGVRALSQAVSLDPALAGPYIELARFSAGQGQFERVEQVLGMALQNLKLDSYLELHQIRVMALEKQGKQTLIYDFLRALGTNTVGDLPSRIYAGRYLADHEQYAQARQVYARILGEAPQQPDALYGMARVAFAKDRDAVGAIQLLRAALAVNPQLAEAQVLLKDLESKFTAPPADANSAPLR